MGYFFSWLNNLHFPVIISLKEYGSIYNVFESQFRKHNEYLTFQGMIVPII